MDVGEARVHGPDGTLADFEVAYTFGVYRLQQIKTVEFHRAHVMQKMGADMWEKLDPKLVEL